MSFSLWPWFAEASLRSMKPAKSDHPIYPRLSGKSFIGQMGKTNFAPFSQKRLLGCRNRKIARFKLLLKTGPDASCNPRATGRSGCTPAEPYPPSARSRSSTITPNAKTISRCLFHLRQRMADFRNPRCLFSLRQQASLSFFCPFRPLRPFSHFCPFRPFLLST